MPEEMTNAPETGATGDAGAGADKTATATPPIRDTPNADGMIPAAEVAGLKSALEKLKGELKDLKPKAGIVDQLLAEGITPDQIPAKLAEIKEQGKAQEQIAQLKAEWESQTRAEREQAEKLYKAQLQSLSTHLQGQTRDKALTDVFLAGGGQAQSEFEAKQFKTLIGDLIEWEDQPVRDDAGTVIAYESKIKKFRSPAGDTLFVDDGKTGQVREAKLEDFLSHLKQGKYGRALQQMLPAYNQSSGSGISGGSGSSGLPSVLPKARMAEIMAGMSDQQLADVRAGKIKFE